MTITVDVISDVICPWCWIGKRRLEKAIVALGMPVKIRWLPFQLNPMMPEEGIRRQAYRIQKFGSWERSQELDVRVAAVGKEEGIDFAFDRIERTPNTQAAHRLIWLAEQEGIQGVVVEALFRAYFTDGRDISNRQTLLDVVADLEAAIDFGDERSPDALPATAAYRTSKGTLQFSHDQPLPLELITQIVAARVQDNLARKAAKQR